MKIQDTRCQLAASLNIYFEMKLFTKDSQKRQHIHLRRNKIEDS